MTDTTPETEESTIAQCRKLVTNLRDLVDSGVIQAADWPGDYAWLVDALTRINTDELAPHTVYQVVTNSDLTEGRGHAVVVATCWYATTAERLAHKAGPQGSHADIHAATAFGERHTGWYAPTYIKGPTPDDEDRQKRREQRRQAKLRRDQAHERAREAGLSEDDIAALTEVSDDE